MDWGVAMSSGAAAVAAVLSGLNLYLSGRRDRGKWLRETTVDALAAFLEASFAHNAACVGRARPSVALSASDLQALRGAVVEAHDRQTGTLTRLRLLAPPAVVSAAEALHEAEHDKADACFLGLISDEDLATLLRDGRAARERFLTAARGSLGLTEAAAITHRHEGRQWETLKYGDIPSSPP